MKDIVNFITETREVKNKKFLSLLKQAGWDNVTLEDDRGTVYVYDKVGDVQLSDSAWYGVYFREQKPEHWVLDIAIKYFQEGDIDNIKNSSNIHPNFEFLYSLCDDMGSDSKYFRKELDKYSSEFK